MKQLHRQAFFFFLVPMLAVLLVGVPYGLSGHPARALEVGPTVLDVAVWGYLLIAVLVPPIWGYRLTVRMARALAHTTEAARRLAEGDFSRRSLAAWTQENTELFDLEQSINATAVHLQERVAELGIEKARLEAILSNMADGVLLVDSKKRIMLVNPAAESMFGISAAETLGKDHLEVTHHFQLDELLSKVLATSQPQVLEIKRARPEEQILEARLAPTGRADEIQGVLIVIRDVTRSRKLEQMRTEFVSNVTHELRTPLTAIRGFAETLLEGALEDPDTALHFVEIIKRESDHLGHLIEDLLDLSRIESGKLKVRKEPVDLAALAAETVGRLAQKAEGLGVRLNLEFPEALPVISGDPARLAQVLINLVDNGLKYTPAGGSVTVSAEEAGLFLRVTVRDTGVGIPKADLPRIFERFYRVDKARSRATGGTGLGLSIVKHIVDAHGGSITCVSDVGQGAVFIFTLPIS